METVIPTRRNASQVLSSSVSDGIDNNIDGPGGQLRANAIAFHDWLGTQRPNPFDVPGARGSVDAGAGFLRHLRRAGADTARRTAHQDRLSQFDPTRTRRASATR